MRLLDRVRNLPISKYHPFAPHRKVTEYLGQAGNEPNGLRLPWWILDSHANSISRRQPEEFVVVGEDVVSDGTRHLRFAARREFLEATTHWRADPSTGRLRTKCPACDSWDGKHKRGCEG